MTFIFVQNTKWKLLFLSSLQLLTCQVEFFFLLQTFNLCESDTWSFSNFLYFMSQCNLPVRCVDWLGSFKHLLLQYSVWMLYKGKKQTIYSENVNLYSQKKFQILWFNIYIYICICELRKFQLRIGNQLG